MALLHRAQLTPTKLELLTTWLPTQSWYVGSPTPELTVVASYRFDDPAGAVGIETMMVRGTTGPVMQVPMTYRDAPVDSLAPWLVTTMDHSVLGQRWAYDGCADPVYAAALAAAILSGGTEAEVLVEVDGTLEERPKTAWVSGSGSAAAPQVDHVTLVEDGDPTVVTAGGVRLVIARTIAAGSSGLAADGADTLAGTWTDQPTPVVLATALTTG